MHFCSTGESHVNHIHSIDEGAHRERRRCGRRKRLVCFIYILNDEGMATCDFLGIFMTRKVPG